MNYLNRLIIFTLLIFISVELKPEEIKSSYAQICFTFEDNRMDTCLYTDEYTFTILKNYLANGNSIKSDSLSYNSEIGTTINISRNYNLNNYTMDNFFGFILHSIPEMGEIEVELDEKIIRWGDRNQKIKEVCLLSQTVTEPLNNKISRKSFAGVNGVNGFYSITPIAESRSKREFLSEKDDSDVLRSPIYLKTNLLFDVLTAVNVEIEYPVLPNLSIAAEWLFPWWINEKKQNCLQVLRGTAEVKYWFKSADIRKSMLEGWYLGAFYSAGIYDLEYKKKGYQGDVYHSAGISLGYSYNLTKSLSAECGVSLGYINTDYTKYEAAKNIDDNWVLFKKSVGNYTYWGPTNIKLSIVWRPEFSLKSKRGNN